MYMRNSNRKIIRGILEGASNTMCHLKDHMETYCYKGFLKYICIGKESKWSHHILRSTMPKVDVLCHQVKPCAGNGLCLVELLTRGVPCNSQTTQAVAKVIGCASQLDGRVLLLKIAHVIHFYLICISVCLKTCLTHVMPCPRWPENGT